MVRSDADVLIQLENDWGNALLRQDVDAFSRYVADDCILTTSNGRLITKKRVQADISRGALRIESFRLDDVKVRVYGDAAIVLGTILEKSKLNEKDTSGGRRFIDVFVKLDGRWQAVASHESRVSTE